MTTYSQWLRRPVNVVQVYTTSVSRTLFGWTKVRVVGRYKRDIPTAAAVRKQLAEILRQYRAEGLTRRQVRTKAEDIFANPRGWAIRCDIDAGLRAMASYEETNS